MEKNNPDAGMIEKARKLHELKLKVEEYETKVKSLEAQMVDLERNLIEHITDTYQESGGNSFDISTTHKAILVTRSHPSIVSGSESQVHDWLRTQGFPSAVREYVFPQTFKRILAEIAEKREVDIKDVVNTDLLNLVNVFVEKKVTFRKK